MNKSVNIYKINFKTALVILGAVFTFFSCKHKPEIADRCVTVVPVTVSFQNNILPFFRTYCSNPGCHSGGSPAGHLNLVDSVAFTELWKPGTGYLDTVQPGNSVLYGAMTTASKIMPPAGKTDDCYQELILKWIQQGAKNN